MGLALKNFQMTNQARPLLNGYLAMAALTGDPSFIAKARDLSRPDR
jgi:hypothetical protein